MAKPNIIFTQCFQGLFAKLKGRPASVEVALKLPNGRKFYESHGWERGLPETLEALQAKTLKGVAGCATEVRFYNLFKI